MTALTSSARNSSSVQVNTVQVLTLSVGYCCGVCVGIIHIVNESSGLTCLNLRGEPYVLDVFEQDKGVTNP